MSEIIEINGEALEYDDVIYVDAENGDDSNDGTKDSPYENLSKATSEINENSNEAIYLYEGLYNYTSIESLFDYKGIDLIGEGLGSVIEFQEGNSSDLGYQEDIDTDFYRMKLTVSDDFQDNCMYEEEYDHLLCEDGAESTHWDLGFYNVVIDIKDQIDWEAIEFDGSDEDSITIDKLELINVSARNEQEGTFLGSNWDLPSVDNVKLHNIAYNQSVLYDIDTEGADIEANLEDVTYDSDYNITSDDDWENAGTGENPDGTDAHIGVYGGTYAFGSWDYMIEGMVTKDGSPVEGAEVFIINADNEEVIVKTTDSEGKYKYSGNVIEDATYHLLVAHSEGEEKYTAEARPFISPVEES